MALTNTYLVTTKNLEAFLHAVQSAKAPERFNNKFLTQLDFRSSNDRLYIGLFKALGFIDDAGTPTKRYYSFLDQGDSAKVLAEAIREAYEDLFAVNKKAYDLALADVKNKLKTLTQGSKSENVINLMASTFKALCGIADWKHSVVDKDKKEEQKNTRTKNDAVDVNLEEANPVQRTANSFALHYDIHVHLPESRDPAVFDAIFDAMKKHLSS